MALRCVPRHWPAHGRLQNRWAAGFPAKGRRHRHFYARPGARAAKVRQGGPVLDEVNEALGNLEELFPDSIGEACFIDRAGPENARMVRGVRATVASLSPDESGNPFFGPTFALRPGQVYQARPYESPDTKEWVISNSTLMPTRTGPSGRSCTLR
jgi:hypothetical protein